MMLHEITGSVGRHERRKRVGRGESSGMGRTSGRGNKGAQSRAGGGRARLLHEGGQRPFFMGIAKRGFSNFHFRIEYRAVNVGELEANFKDGTKLGIDELKKLGVVRRADKFVKILGEGELTKKLHLTAHAFSATAKAAIEKAGGSCTIIPQRDSAAVWTAKRNSAKKVRVANKASKKPQPTA